MIFSMEERYIKCVSIRRSNRPRHSPHYNTMLHIVEEMQNYTHAWPFLEPVSIEDVADYYDIIKDPMGKFHWP